jgi:hypothetical protein
MTTSTLDTDGLKTDLLAAFLPPGTNINPDSQDGLIEQVNKIADAIETYIKSGTINTTVDVKIPPLAVAVGAGPAAAPNPVQIPLTGTGTGKIE